jgi:hypothetical protein
VQQADWLHRNRHCLHCIAGKSSTAQNPRSFKHLSKTTMAPKKVLPASAKKIKAAVSGSRVEKKPAANTSIRRQVAKKSASTARE